MTVPRHKVVVAVILHQDAPLAPLNKEILEAVYKEWLAAVGELAAAVLMEVIFIIAI